MYDVLKQRDIYTTRGQVSHKQYAHKLLSELEELIFTTALIHRTIDVVCLEAALEAELVQVLNVILGRAKDDCLLSLFHMLPQYVEQGSFFLPGTHNKELQL